MRLNQEKRILGMMSGTSVDSIDAALCVVSEDKNGRIQSSIEGFYEHPMPPGLRSRIFELFLDGPGSLSLACSLNFEIGEAFAEAALAAFAELGVNPRTVDAIASHGQTAYHIAPHMAAALAKLPEPGRKIASTLQIGEASLIAESVGVQVISDFRVADMAAGGNGAPLVPFADFHLFSERGRNIVVHNIGGIANCTFLPATGRIEDTIAFDIGPGNMIIDAMVQRFYCGERYDRDGHHARAGKILQPLLADWMSIDYIRAPPPKTTGRELFGVPFAKAAAERCGSESPDDLIATAAAFTAQSFALNVASHLMNNGAIDAILVGGGGAHNPFLMEQMQLALKDRLGASAPSLKSLDETHIPSKARECVAFAILGYARLMQIPGNVPSATGAEHPAVLGKITMPYPTA